MSKSYVVEKIAGQVESIPGRLDKVQNPCTVQGIPGRLAGMLWPDKYLARPEQKAKDINHMQQIRDCRSKKLTK